MNGIKDEWQTEDGSIRLLLGDCLEILPGLGSVDAVVTDPFYGIDGGRGTVSKGRGRGNYSDLSDTPQEVSRVCVVAIEWAIANATTVVVTPGNRCMSLYPQPDSFGCFYQPAAVGLQTFGNLDAQPIFYYGKNGTKAAFGKPCSYLLTESAEVNGHPCPKPIRAWTKLVRNTTAEHSIVLDPFMGSGTTGVACIRLGRKFIGIEKEPKYFEIAKKRIRDELDKTRLIEAPRKLVQRSLIGE